MAEALRPRLTVLDERVLAAVPEARPGRRLDALVREVSGRGPHATVDEQDVLEILRGLEAVELVENWMGWWARRQLVMPAPPCRHASADSVSGVPDRQEGGQCRA